MLYCTKPLAGCYQSPLFRKHQQSTEIFNNWSDYIIYHSNEALWEVKVSTIRATPGKQVQQGPSQSIALSITDLSICVLLPLTSVHFSKSGWAV